MQSRHALNKYNGAAATNISVYVNRCQTNIHTRQQTEDSNGAEQIEIARKIPFERPFHYSVPASIHTNIYICILFTCMEYAYIHMEYYVHTYVWNSTIRVVFPVRFQFEYFLYAPSHALCTLSRFYYDEDQANRSLLGWREVGELILN